MQKKIIEDYTPENYEQQTKLLSIKLISIPSVLGFEQCHEIIIGYIDKRYHVWKICDSQINAICSIQNENYYAQTCQIWRYLQQTFIIIINELEFNILDPESQQIIQSYQQYLLFNNQSIRALNFQQFQQQQFIYSNNENRIRLRKIQNQQMIQEIIVQQNIRQFQTNIYSQYLQQRQNILIRINRSNKIYRKLQGEIKGIREPYSIQTRTNGYKGYTCRVIDTRDMKLKLQFSCSNEDFKDSLFIKEENLILILNEYSLWIFSSINMRLLDVEQFPINKTSINEPWKLNYRQGCLEIFCQKFSMNQFYRLNQI